MRSWVPISGWKATVVRLEKGVKWRQSPIGHWPASLAKSMSSGLSKRPCSVSKIKVENSHWSVFHTHVNMDTSQTDRYTHTHRLTHTHRHKCILITSIWGQHLQPIEYEYIFLVLETMNYLPTCYNVHLVFIWNKQTKIPLAQKKKSVLFLNLPCIWYIAEVVIEFLIPLPLPPECCWVCRCDSPCPVGSQVFKNAHEEPRAWFSIIF
jgi:hypothetical protein